MDIRARQKNNIVILDLSGRIDVDSANLVEAIAQCLRDGYSDIICNLEEVDFIDYMGLSAISRDDIPHTLGGHSVIAYYQGNELVGLQRR